MGGPDVLSVVRDLESELRREKVLTAALLAERAERASSTRRTQQELLGRLHEATSTGRHLEGLFARREEERAAEHQAVLSDLAAQVEGARATGPSTGRGGRRGCPQADR